MDSFFFLIGFYELSDGASGSLSNSSNSVFSECLSSCHSSTCFCSSLDASLSGSDGRPKSAGIARIPNTQACLRLLSFVAYARVLVQSTKLATGAILGPDQPCPCLFLVNRSGIEGKDSITIYEFPLRGWLLDK